jgi:hypothetical protein
MMWQTISSQQQLDQLIARFDWSHAFVREAYLVSPSFVIAQGERRRWTVRADALPSMKFLITSDSERHPALELFFIEVEDMGVWFGGGELAPSATCSERGIVWQFHKDLERLIRAAYLRYAFLDEAAWGNKLRYGWENFFDDAGQVQ